MTLADLKAKLDRMSPAKIRFAARLIDELDRAQPATVKQRGTWITTSADWLEHFSLALSVHHGATSEPLLLTSFENVFRAACESAGWSVSPPASPTQRFVDLTVDAGSGVRPALFEIDCGPQPEQELGAYFQADRSGVDPRREEASRPPQEAARAVPRIRRRGGRDHDAQGVPRFAQDSPSLPAHRDSHVNIPIHPDPAARGLPA